MMESVYVQRPLCDVNIHQAVTTTQKHYAY